MTESLPALIVHSMEGPVLPLLCHGVGFSSFGKSSALGGAGPHELDGDSLLSPAGVCFPSNCSSTGKGVKGLVQTAWIAPKEAPGRLREDFGGVHVGASLWPSCAAPCLSALFACSSKNTPGSRGSLCSGGSALGSAPGSSTSHRAFALASAKPPCERARPFLKSPFLSLGKMD